MINKIYSLYDKTANQFLGPIMAANDGMALRILEQIVNDPQTNVAAFPADFSMYLLGEFNTSPDDVNLTTDSIYYGKSKCIGQASDYLKS